MSYAVIGAGAIGGFYGGKLAHAGAEVHFLFRSAAEYVKREGLQIRSPEGDVSIPEVNAHADWSTIPRVDVALVAVKATVNADIAARLNGILKPGGMVLLIQNGLGAEPEFAGRLIPDAELIGGLAFISSQRTGPNEVSHFDFGLLTIASYRSDYAAAGITDGMRELETDFSAAGVPVMLDEDLLLARYKKLLWNVPFNALSVILDADTGQMINDADICDLALACMTELRQAAAAEGRDIPEQAAHFLLEGTKAMKPYAPSMKVDYDAGRQLEVEALLGEPLSRANRIGVEMPTIAALYRQLRFLNQRLQPHQPAHRPREQ